VVLDATSIAERQAVLQYQEGKVLFLNLNAAVAAFKGKAPVSFCELELEEEIRLGDLRLRLVKRQDGPATLEGYSPPYQGRRWILREEVTLLGLQGKRENHVSLDDPTVSRTHGFIKQEGDRFVLHPDTLTVPTFVNGHKIAGPKPLGDGDLIQLGVQMLRFRLSRKPAASAGELPSRMATVLFADIWNYAALSDSRALDELIRQVGDFYEMVEEVVTAHKGRLSSYMGDSVVVIFVPENPAGAVESALTIQERMEALNHNWLGSGLPPFRVGIGIHTGQIVLGDLSLQGKSELAAVGGQADVAAEVEKLTKSYDARILLTQPSAAGLEGRYDLHSRGVVKLAGTPGPLEIFQVERVHP
jgi:class 3 adenylate cyclase